MKKTVSSILLASALLLGAIAPVTANAAAVGGDGTGGTGTTSGTVTFTKPDATTTPVDPTDPTKPGTDTNPGGTTPGGDLTFLYISPDMDFGTQKADQTAGATAVTYNPKTITSTAFNQAPKTPTLVSEVSDTRGSSAGWQVSVKSSALTDTSDSKNTVTGATIDLNGGNATIMNTADATNLPTGSDANLTTGATGNTLYTAATGTGVGTTSMQLKSNDIALSNIPANVKASVAGTTYKATLTWTLGDTPEG